MDRTCGKCFGTGRMCDNCTMPESHCICKDNGNEYREADCDLCDGTGEDEDV